MYLLSMNYSLNGIVTWLLPWEYLGLEVGPLMKDVKKIIFADQSKGAGGGDGNKVLSYREHHFKM